MKFLATMFGQRLAAQVFVTSLANDKSAARRIPPRHVVTRDYKRIEAFAAEWDRPERALYFCVATIKPGKTWQKKENLGELVCLHADLDFKNIEEDREAIERVLDNLPLLPQLVVFSGHGLHCYWLLDKPLPATDDNIERVERLLKKLAAVLAGDPAVCEVARLMRLPGSHNTKFDQWTEVVVIEKRSGHYTLKQLETWLAASPALLRRTPHKRSGKPDNPFRAFANENSVRAPIDVEQRLAEMQFHGPEESGIHNTQLSVTAALLRRGYPLDAVVFRVLKATVAAAGHEGRSWDWFEEERGLRKMCSTWLKKHPRVFFREG